jgi:hypothetical protein
MRVGTTLLYLGASACAYASYLQVAYLIDYFRDPMNPYREEYLGGILMVGLLSAAV